MGLLTEGYLESGEIALHYWRSGGDKPPIVLAHGFSDSGLCWASMISALAPHFDVIAYDARAHGRSFASTGPWSIDHQAADLLGLIDHLGLRRPVLMGHSMGGLAVFWAAIEQPDVASALIFEDSAIPRPIPAADAAAGSRNMAGGMRDWVASLQSKSVEELIALCRENSPLWPEEDYRPWAESKLQLNLDAIARFSMFGDRDLADYHSKLACPSLFLMADVDEAEKVRRQELIKALPQGRIEHVEGAGHNVRRDQPASTHAILEEFLGVR